MSQGFSEARLDPEIGRQAEKSVEWRTEVTELESSAEERNGKWARSRRRYNIGYGVRELDKRQAIEAFFEARQGRLFGFRFKDWADYRTAAPGVDITPLDQFVGTGDGASARAQLVKRYSSGFEQAVRRIAKPRPDIRVAIDGVETTDFEVDFTTGIVTFPSVLAEGAVISWGGEFDVPVRFASDTLTIRSEGEHLAQIPRIELIEDPNYLSAAEQAGLLFLNLANPLEQLINVDWPALWEQMA